MASEAATAVLGAAGGVGGAASEAASEAAHEAAHEAAPEVAPEVRAAWTLGDLETWVRNGKGAKPRTWSPPHTSLAGNARRGFTDATP